jgi:hypothetical protein
MIFWCQSCGEQHTQPGAAQVTLTHCVKCCGSNFATWPPNQSTLARSEGFREGVEAAARVANRWADAAYHPRHHSQDNARLIAKEIRALSPRETDASIPPPPEAKSC